MLKSIAVRLAIAALVVVTSVIANSSPAMAKFLCPDGEIQTVIAGTGQVICTVKKPRKSIEEEVEEEGSRNYSRDRPDPETLRKWKVQESVEFMCREFQICAGDDVWERSECSMDPDAPYGAGRGLPGERCPTYVQPDDEDSSEDDDGPPRISPEQAVQQVIAKLKFTAATPQVGPNRDHHDLPFDTAVGYPVWLWTTGGTSRGSVTETVGPLTVGISIELEKVVWNLGDGTTQGCDKGTKWKRGAPAGSKSPTCGHVFEKPGRYTIEATTHWTIAWSAGGQSGYMPYSITSDRPFEVGEIHVLVR